MPSARKDLPPTDALPLGIERDRLRKRAWYQQNKEKQRKERAEKNRKNGHAPRPKDGPKAKPRVQVPKARRFQIIAGLIYFNSELGYDVMELEAILEIYREQAAKKTGRTSYVPPPQKKVTSPSPAAAPRAEMQNLMEEFMLFRQFMELKR